MRSKVRPLKIGDSQKTEKVTPTRSIEKILELTHELGPVEVVKTLTEDEVITILLEGKETKEEATRIDSRKKELYALLKELAKFRNQKKIAQGGVTLSISSVSTYHVDALSVAKYLLTLRLSKEEMDEKFNAIFTVNVTKARKLIGEEALDKLGGHKVTNSWGKLTLK